jgi:protein associated with RNAse G/E
MYLLDDSLYEYDPDALLTTDLGVLKTVEGLDFELDKEIEDDVELDSLLDPNEYSQILSDYKYLPDEDFDIAEFLENAEAHDAKASKKKNSKTKKK